MKLSEFFTKRVNDGKFQISSLIKCLRLLETNFDFSIYCQSRVRGLPPYQNRTCQIINAR